ncbi:impB/mucB/samB family protein [Hypoxylon fragiforme]|uniref:impB/mucB/samB family protein n=1 Tax=Hypoxylon fragiforme TaxID=63214 RepID=UPI0020C6DFC5|nr:impB/mucB/samB family protein [Hypoxylon fragiforme]KAI2613588.1 impB/mucB/samB family protein [Hypoxylon fragiforme]
MGSRLENNSNAVRKRISSHAFSDEAGEEYEPSKFGGFGDYFRRKKIKLQNLDSELRASSTEKPQIFKGVVAHVIGYTQPPLPVLHRELVQHGAGFLQYLDSKTMATHIIASTLPPKKMVEYAKYRIVKPAWVTESIQAGKLLPWSDYRVIEDTPRQKTLKLHENGISTQSSTPQSPLVGYREQTEKSFYTSQLRGVAQSSSGHHRKYSSSSRLDSVVQNQNDYGARFKNTKYSTSSLEPQGTPSGTGKSEEDTVMLVEYGEPADTGPARRPRSREKDEIEDEDEVQPEPSAEQPKAMTSEKHNEILLQDPRMRKSSTANPDFIQQYYSESRLHHLSTWKAELKSKMQKLAAEKGSQTKLPKRKPGARRYIMHVDFDSFFCAVSLKGHPEFVDKPAVVAHGTGTGSEIASCNYPARKFGVKNGMWMKRAKELCADIKVLPYDFPAYEEASKQFYECILEVGGVVQSVSIDEALVDITSVVLLAVGSDGSGVDEGSIWREQEKADQLALALRNQIKEKAGCAVSVGIGANILLAKVALRKAKPAGQYQIKPEEVLDFLGPLKVDSLPGVAYSIAGKLEEIGIKLVNDIRQATKERLVTTLGPKTGEKLWEYARGIDRTEVGEQPIRKSVSAEVNWGIRFINQEEAEEFVHNLCKELEKRLLNEQVKGKQLTMKIMRRSLDAPLDPPKHLGHGKCDTFNKSVMFGVATNDHHILGKEAVSILRSYKFTPGDLRGLGVQLTKLEPLKTSLAGNDGSQKKLSFGTFKVPGAKKSALESIQDEDVADEVTSKQGRRKSSDPIDESPLTPRKPKPDTQHPALAMVRAREADSKANTLLNIGGTQFLMPSNPDPTVLAELPLDIRSRLMAQGTRSVSEPRSVAVPALGSRPQTPIEEIPPEIDPEVFNALPDDMKAEVLEQYKPRNRPPQPLRPSSPRRDRLIQPPKQRTPTKRRIPNLFTRTRERHADANAKVVQTNILSYKQQQPNDNTAGAAAAAAVADLDEIDPTFLAELPEEVRREVIADHRRQRAQRSGLSLPPKPKNPKPNNNNNNNNNNHPPQSNTNTLPFPPRPPKLPFTTSALTSLPEIRDMLNVWHRETATEGPHGRDVQMLVSYLTRVVVDERDMDKALKLVRWLEYLVEDSRDSRDNDNPHNDDDGGGGGGGGGGGVDNDEFSRGKEAWRDVVGHVKMEVQKAVRSRGLGQLDI